MGALTRAFDWAATSVGEPADWSPSLRTTLSILLSSRFPMFLWWGPDLIQFYNDAYRPLLGNDGKHPRALGQPAEECWPELWSFIKPLIDQVMTTGEATWHEDQRMSFFRNGQLENVYVTFSYSPVRDEADEVAGVLVVCQETTRKVAQVEESEERFSTYVQHSPTSIGIYIGPDMVIQTANDAMLRSWGKDASVIGKTLREALPELEGQPFHQLLHEVYTTGVSYQATEDRVDLVHDGELRTFYYNFTYKALRDGNGQIYGIINTATDVTEMVRAKQQLTETENNLLNSVRQFTFVTDFMPQIVWATQPDGSHDFYNRRWYEFTGLTYEESFGEGWARVLHPDDVERTTQVWQHSLDTGQLYEIEYRMRRHDGMYRWLLARALPMHNEQGDIIRWFGTCTDIHDQKLFSTELEHEVQQRTQALSAVNLDLQRSNENLQRFAYVASHDLQEPLRKIQSFGDLLVTGYGSQLGDGIDLVERMQQAANRMSVLIKDLLAFSRLGNQRDTFRPVSLSAVVEGVLNDLDMVVKETEATIRISPLPTILGDATQLNQLFHNLISNALKFRQPHQPPCIGIDTQTVAAIELPASLKPTSMALVYHRITVTDNGIGFDEKYLDRIFQIFQRLHGKSQYAGTGIGLAIVQKVVENHGGVITATSQPQAGATFTLYLPQAM